MKRAYIVPILALTALVLSTLACGSTEPAQPIIETAAADMNLSAADLGFDWSPMSDQGLDEMPAMDQPHIRDANMRMFSSESLMGMVTSILFSAESVAAAQQEMQGDAVQNLGADMEAQLENLTLAKLDAPDLGDEAVMVGGNIPELNMNVYVLALRKANVVAMVSVLGTAETVTEDLMADYAQKLETKIK